MSKCKGSARPLQNQQLTDSEGEPAPHRSPEIPIAGTRPDTKNTWSTLGGLLNLGQKLGGAQAEGVTALGIQVYFRGDAEFLQLAPIPTQSSPGRPLRMDQLHS
jgi:hypothetical protein